jgi:hypothetical protein
MSLASAYADAVAAANSGIAGVQAVHPAPFVGPNGRADVTDTGKLRLTPTGAGVFEISAAGALLFRDWLTATFG